MPHSAINCKRLVSKCAWGFWTNAHESEAAEDDCLLRWIETTTDLAKCTSRRTCKRISHRIIPAQLLNRGSISSSSTYISPDLQEELLTGSYQRSYWTDGGSRFHPHTSHRTCKRNFSQDHASPVTEQTEDLIFIHIQGMDSRKTFKVFLIMTLNNVHWCN